MVRESELPALRPSVARKPGPPGNMPFDFAAARLRSGRTAVGFVALTIVAEE
jgi:hypothetical protein